jgi:hypothetical protein
MEKFLYLFKGGIETTQNASPEAMQGHLQKWMQWMQKLAQDGTFISGEPLEPSGKKVSGIGKIVTDGPFAETKELVGGYMMVNANDINHAVEISKGCPVLEVGGHVEIRPIHKMEM